MHIRKEHLGDHLRILDPDADVLLLRLVEHGCADLLRIDRSDNSNAPSPISPVFRPWPGIPTS